MEYKCYLNNYLFKCTFVNRHRQVFIMTFLFKNRYANKIFKNVSSSLGIIYLFQSFRKVTIFSEHLMNII